MKFVVQDEKTFVVSVATTEDGDCSIRVNDVMVAWFKAETGQLWLNCYAKDSGLPVNRKGYLQLGNHEDELFPLSLVEEQHEHRISQD